MFPFFDFYFFKVPSYGLFILLGIFFASGVSYYLIKQQKKNFDFFILITATVIGVGFSVAKLLFILVTYPIEDFFSILWETIFSNDNSSRNSGFVFYGGLIGGVLGFLLGCKLSKVSFWEYANIFAVAIPIAHAFGRIGCLGAGCCYGIPYDGICAIHYSNPVSSVPLGIGIFPVQALESILLFCLGIFLFFHEKKQKSYTILLYLAIYPVVRFITEFFRFDKERGFIASLSVSQFISLILFTISLVSYFLLRKKR